MAPRGKPGLDALSVPLDTAPMEARQLDALPTQGSWQYEPKWDGFRCLAFKEGDAVELRAKSGKSLSRYFPEIVAALQALTPSRFVLDGELVVPVGDGLSFDALQMRLHPAESRVRKLAVETPALLMLFDYLMTDEGVSLLTTPLAERRALLEAYFASLDEPPLLRLSPATRDSVEAERWLAEVGEIRARTDGVIAKPADGAYLAGERAMIKVKRLRTADCVVGGFRYAREKSGNETKQVGSLLLGLYDEAGKLDHVGFTSGIADSERAALTKRLEKLIEPPGFTGDAPGGPSRWSDARSADWQPLRPELVVEVRYDHVTGDRFRHGTKLVRWRPDKAPRQCTVEQIA